jgi:hypothetical protein
VQASKARVVTPVDREDSRTEMQWVVLEESVDLAVEAMRRVAPRGPSRRRNARTRSGRASKLRRGVPRLLA